MSFIVYDLIILGICAIAIGSFLYKNRKRIQKEGLLLLYRTKLGIKLINYVGKKFNRTFKVLEVLSVGVGYLLMVGVVWLFYTIIKIYVFRPDVVSAIKVPPIMPLIPYIDKVVPFLPPFYFMYWVIILAVIAISHEFAHGIFMRRYNIKIKSTGFGFFPFFLPIFPLAFVEQNEKSMMKAKNFEQRAVLSAGTFANLATSVVFFGVLALFFTTAFQPTGIVFDDYAYDVMDISSITSINGVLVANPSFDNVMALAENATFNNITSGGRDFAGIKGYINEEQIALYYDAPFIKNGVNGAITEVNGVETKNLDEFSDELSEYSPGDEIEIVAKTSEEEKTYEIVLGESPDDKNKAWVGIVFLNAESNGLMGKIFASLSSFKKSEIFYESGLGEFGWFVYYLLWWLIIISISVALINMLPMGIFDGGRFFYLTILAITKKESWARKGFKWATSLFLFIIFLLMILWVYALVF